MLSGRAPRRCGVIPVEGVLPRGPRPRRRRPPWSRSAVLSEALFRHRRPHGDDVASPVNTRVANSRHLHSYPPTLIHITLSLGKNYNVIFALILDFQLTCQLFYSFRVVASRRQMVTTVPHC